MSIHTWQKTSEHSGIGISRKNDKNGRPNSTSCYDKTDFRKNIQECPPPPCVPADPSTQDTQTYEQNYARLRAISESSWENVGQRHESAHHLRSNAHHLRSCRTDPTHCTTWHCDTVHQTTNSMSLHTWQNVKP